MIYMLIALRFRWRNSIKYMTHIESTQDYELGQNDGLEYRQDNWCRHFHSTGFSTVEQFQMAVEML